MRAKPISKMTLQAGECLKNAVHAELQKKALLGQYVIINHDGKTCRILAKDALELAKLEGKS